MRRAVLAVILALVLLISAAFPASGEMKNVFKKNESAGKRVALTFDDGPHPARTAEILEILREYDVSATFFVIGKNVENYPDAFEALLKSGCEIGNHTYSHKVVAPLSEAETEEEFRKTEECVIAAGGERSSLIRPPTGDCGGYLDAVSRRHGYNVILWSIDTKDWEHRPAGEIVKSTLEKVGDGDIILMHDYIAGHSPTCDVLRAIIPELLHRGYEFVSVSELIYCE